MSLQPRTCPICKSPAKNERWLAISGEEQPVAVTVKRMPLLECENGHRLFPNAEFPLLLLDHLIEEQEPRLPASEAKGLVIKRYHCSRCGAALPKVAADRQTFHVDVELADLPPFEVDLTVPVQRCEHCGQEQVHRLKEVKNSTPAALAHAFKSAEIAAA